MTEHGTIDRLGISGPMADRAITICSHLGLFALGTSFGIRIAGSKITPLCQSSVFTAAPPPCLSIIDALRFFDTTGMVSGAVLVLAAVALTLPEWPEAVGGEPDSDP